MRPSIIHSPMLVDGIKSGEGLSLCGGKFSGQILSPFVDEITCPHCKLEWYKKNKQRMTNHPKKGNPIIHYSVQLYNDTWIATCGKLDTEKYHVLASRNINEVTCEGCKNV